MSILVLVVGLAVFLGSHSVRIVADHWRARQIARFGEGRWKGLYSLVSVIGVALIVWGYGLSRANPVDLWNPPAWTRVLTIVLTLPAFVLLAGAYVPGNRIKAVLGHPFVLGVKLWAFAHLLSNGRLGDALLFGVLMIWAAVSFRAARGRDRAAGVAASNRAVAANPVSRDAITVVAGIVAWAVFGFLLHGLVIGVQPAG
jgi:uncharacterized membrane protein